MQAARLKKDYKFGMKEKDPDDPFEEGFTPPPAADTSHTDSSLWALITRQLLFGKSAAPGFGMTFQGIAGANEYW